MANKLRQYLAKQTHLLPLFLLLLIGIVLRFYRFEAFVTFLGDQGRDAIVIKRILTLEHLPAIGAPTSVGQIYLGPFYYYFMAPWLALFRLNPLGLAFGVAFFSCLYILVNYLIVEELFGRFVAFLSSIFITLSVTLINFSRFSWNPNLLPLFSLLTVYFVIKSLSNYKWWFFALAGICLSFSIQLHYLALFLLPPLGVFFLIKLFEEKKKRRSVVIGFIILTVFFLIASFPLVVFDLRHNFLNLKNFLGLFKTSSAISSNKLTAIFNTFLILNAYSFNVRLNLFLSSIILLLIAISFIFLIKRKDNLRTILLFFILCLLGISLYSGPKNVHYFGSLYPFYYIILAYFLSLLKPSLWGKATIVAFVLIYFYLNFQSYYFLFNKGNYQIEKAQAIASKIFHSIDKPKYSVTQLPVRYSDSTMRYFLEIWGKRPLEKDSLVKADELFVICETKCFPVIGNPQWDIAYFAARKIAQTQEVDGVKIYKLVR